MRLLLGLLLAATCLAGEEVPLLVLHTNDLHGQLEPEPPSPVRAVLRGKPAGGFAHLATMVRAAREEGAARGAAVLLLDAGDLFQGTPIGNETRGESVVEAMNALSYDAAAVGNHELDYGLGNLLRLARMARFPMLAANMGGKRSPLREILPYVVLGPPRVPCRIAVIGLVAENTPALTSASVSRSLRFSSPLAAARTLLAEVDADLHVLLTHVGRDEDRALAQALPEADLIVGGHSHTPMVETVNGVLVVQTHAKGLSLGRVDMVLDRDGWRVVRANGRLLEVDPRATEPDPAVAEVIRRHALRLDEKLKQIVGRLAAPLRRVHGHGSSPAGSWIADVIRRAGEAEVGIMNKGGIRCDLEAGDVTAADVYRLMPFDNTVVSMDLSGTDVRALVRRHCEGTGYPGLEWSGIAVEAEPEGDHLRLVSVTVAGEPLDDARTYRVATNSFLAAGGDEFGPFRKGRNVARTDLLLRDALARDLEERSPLTPPVEERLIVTEAALRAR